MKVERLGLESKSNAVNIMPSGHISCVLSHKAASSSECNQKVVIAFHQCRTDLRSDVSSHGWLYIEF